VLVPPDSLDIPRLPFVGREEMEEPVQLRLITRRDEVAAELEELSRKVKARAEQVWNDSRFRRWLKREERRQERRHKR